jgi:ABC-type phosphate transport system substrate-binding protein
MRLRGAAVTVLMCVCVAWMAAPHAQVPAPSLSFVIIVNKANPVKTLTLVDLRSIFMKQSRMWPHAEAMVPVDWDSTSEMRQAFCKVVMNRSVREMSEYYVAQSMTQGVTPPSTQKSSRAILRFVASVPGAISYVPPADLDDTVTVIKITGLK